MIFITGPNVGHQRQIDKRYMNYKYIALLKMNLQKIHMHVYQRKYIILKYKNLHLFCHFEQIEAPFIAYGRN